MSSIISNQTLGIRVEMNESEIYPNDPGQGTPVLVILANGNSATWNCATCEGETVDGDKFTDEQVEWLNEITPRVESWMIKHGA